MNIRRNIGLVDRLIRVVLAVAVAVLILTGQLAGVAAIVLGIAAGIFLLTSVVGVCPLYLPFGLSTRRRSS
jgi:hypothetical protein